MGMTRSYPISGSVGRNNREVISSLDWSLLCREYIVGRVDKKL